MMFKVHPSLQCLYREPRIRISNTEICMIHSEEVRTDKSQAYFALSFALKLPKLSEGKRAIMVVIIIKTTIVKISGNRVEHIS